MKVGNPLSIIGLVVAGASGGIFAEELLDGNDVNLLVPIIGFILAVALIAYGSGRRTTKE